MDVTNIKNCHQTIGACDLKMVITILSEIFWVISLSNFNTKNTKEKKKKKK
jgi:hypothetical protein